MKNDSKLPIAFAPVLYMHHVAEAVQFYKNAFDAKELRRWSNPDGSVHVAEMIIETAMFHIHEEVAREHEYGPHTVKGTTVVIGLFVPDVDEVVAKAVTAGATEKSAAKDYE